jgi:hypothetical protein
VSTIVDVVNGCHGRITGGDIALWNVDAVFDVVGFTNPRLARQG